MMDVLKGNNILIGIVSSAEHDQIPSEIATKIDAVFADKIEDLFTKNALMQTAKDKAEESHSELKAKYDTLETSHDALTAQLKAVTDLRAELSANQAELVTVRLQCGDLENEAARLRHERSLAVDERDTATAMIVRRDGEVARLQLDLKVIQEQLQREIEVRCDAQSQLGDIESRILQLEYREKRIEQERALFNTQVQALELQLTTRTEELLAVRRDSSGRCLLLETHLATSRAEHAVLQKQHSTFQQQYSEILEVHKQTQQDHCDDKHAAQLRLDAFQLELEAQRRLAELYKVDAGAKATHVLELQQALEEAKVRLDEAVERYGDLETGSKAERLAHEELLTKKSECIALLRKELQTANDLLGLAKTGSVPTKGADGEPFHVSTQTSKVFGDDRSAMSVSQIYNRYVRTSEQLVEEREVAGHLRGYIQKIMEELQEKGPLLARQRDDLEHAIATVEQLTHTQEEIVHENDQLRTQCAEQKRHCECNRLRVQLNDMSRQICKLLQQRDLITPGDEETAVGNNTTVSSQDIISKRLVTFSSISELQQNNQRLLAVVRELSAKQEQLEHTEQLEHVMEQLERLREAHSDLLEQQQRQHKLTKMLTGQRDTYKTLYHQAVKSEQPITQLERPYDMVDGNSSMDGDDSHHSTSSTKAHQVVDQQLKVKAEQLEVELAKLHKQLVQLNSENDACRKGKSANEKVLIEVNERLRQETQQLASNNSVLVATLDTTQIHLQTAKRNADVLRKQLEPLEERIHIHAGAQLKLEVSLTHHKDSLFEITTKLNNNEVALHQAEKNVALLTDANERLLQERGTFRQECENMEALRTNIALIKATLERNDADSRLRLEESLADQLRECAALRRRLQEEQDHFRTLAADLQAKTSTAKLRMEEERSAAERLRSDMAQMRVELQTKTEHMHKLQSAQSAGGVSVGVVDSKYRDMEQQLLERQSELDAFNQKMDMAKAALVQHSNYSEEAAHQLTVLNDQYNTYRDDTERQMEEQRTKVSELQEKCSDLEAELIVQRTDNLDEQEQVGRLQLRLNAAVEQIATLEGTVATQMTELEQSRCIANELSDKYSREMALHSDDLRALTVVRSTVETVQDELRQLQCQNTNLLDEHAQKQDGWKTRDELMHKEKAQLQQRFDDLMAQNTLLHDQIQEMNANMSVLQVQRAESASNVSLNRSFTEEDVKNSDSQLVKIMKYLRQEKDYALNKAEIIESEQTRLRLDLDLAQKQLTEARQALDEERHKSEAVLVGNAKYAEVLRKVETMNAITDSNRTLRSERDQLLAQVAKLCADFGKLESESTPLQEQLNGLQRRCEALQGENATLRGEATRWRQRANTLIEKTNRTSPEDWKKLQTERETLAKQLTIERANVVRLNDDLTTANRERTKLDDMVKTLRNTASQLKDVTDEMSAVKTELQQLKTDHSQLNTDHITLGKDLSNKDGQLADLRNQLAQVRKIAKKYKVQCEEMQATSAAAANDAAQLSERIVKLEDEMRTQQETTSATIAQLTAKNDVSLQEVERTTQQMQASKERFAALIKNAKDRIVELTQAKNKAESDRDRLLLREQGVTAAGPSGDNTSSAAGTTDGSMGVGDEPLAVKLERMEAERDRQRGEVEELKERLAQMQRLLEESSGSSGTSGSGQATDSRTVGVATEQPTVAVAPHRAANIKPMMSVAHPHVASIRPHRATATTTPSTLAVPPQQVQAQVQVHTTAPSTTGMVTVDNSSPTSSHEQQQQLPTIRVLPLVVDTSGSSNPTSNTSASTSSSTAAVVVGVVSATTSNAASQQQQQQTAAASTSTSTTSTVAPIVAAVTASTSSATAAAGSSSSSSNSSGSSATVTTSGVKRMRSAEDSSQSDSTTAQQQQQAGASTSGVAAAASAASGKVQAQVQPQVKRSRLVTHSRSTQQLIQLQQDNPHEQQQLVAASDEGAVDGTPVEHAEADDATAGDVEYQVPTSSQRDHDDDVDEQEEDMDDDVEEDMQVIDLVESDDEDDEDDDEDEDDDAEAAAAEADAVDDGEEEEEEEGMEEVAEEEEDGDAGEGGEEAASDRKRKRRMLEDEDVIDEEEEQDDDVVEEHGMEDEEGDEAAVVAAVQAVPADVTINADDAERQEESGQQMEATSSSAATTSSGTGVGGGNTRQQQVAPMAAVSSRQHQQQQQQLLLPEECADDSIVPSTPTLFLPRRGASGDGVSSPHPHVPTVGQGRLFTFAEQQATSGADGNSGGEQEVQEQRQDTAMAVDDGEQATGRSVPSTPHHVLHSPPPSSAQAATGSAAGDGEGANSQLQQVEGSEEAIVGEASATAGAEDEGREAEATPATVASAQQQGNGGVQRRSTRPVSSSSSSINAGSASQAGQSGSRQVTPIVWDNQQPGQLHRTSPRHTEMVRGRGLPVQRARRSRGSMLSRGAHGYSRY